VTPDPFVPPPEPPADIRGCGPSSGALGQADPTGDRPLATDPGRRKLRAIALLPMAKSKPLDLKSIWLFSNCNGAELRQLRSSLDEVRVPRGKVLVEEGKVGREFFLIVEGSAAVTRHGRKVATLQPSSYFGELSLLDRQPRSASVTCTTDMMLLVLAPTGVQ
jgi:CRP-like cAMP-binding protein